LCKFIVILLRVLCSDLSCIVIVCVLLCIATCVCLSRSELSSKLQDTLEMIDESMDVALSKICCHFDNDYYTRIQTAYRLLGKTQVSLIMSITVYIFVSCATLSGTTED